MRQILDASGQPVILGREIARGGEGAVYELPRTPQLVAKLYLRDDRQKIEKLRIMPLLGTSDLLRVAAWPTETLLDDQGNVVGFKQPRVNGHQEIHLLYSPANRKVHFPLADWAFLVHVAMNVAGAIETVHQHGHVIGDINQSGIFVSAEKTSYGTVRLIDCDSFQIRHQGRVHVCTVGVPQFTPPEMVGRDFQVTERTQQHDSFGLSLIIFHLLFMGRHPFAGKFSGSGDMPIERAISEGRYAFSRQALSFQMAPPPHSLTLGVFPSPIEQMFERAFRGGHGARPSAGEWWQALKRLKESLHNCSNDKSHIYPPAANDCPWCKIEESGGPAFFISGSVSDEFSPAFDLQAIWLRLWQVSIRQFEKLNPTASKGHFTPTAMPRDARPELLGDPPTVPPEPLAIYESLPTIPSYQPAFSPNDPPFELENISLLPTFQPLPEPPLPPFEETPLPPSPPLDRHDHLADVNAAFIRALNFRRFRHARRGLLISTTAFVLALPISKTLALVVFAVGLAYLGRYLWLYLPRHKVKKKYLSKAYGRMVRQTQRNDYLIKIHFAACGKVQKENDEARKLWEGEVQRIEALRKSLPQKNAELYAQWESSAAIIRALQQEVRKRNESKLAAWRAEMQAAEKQRVASWENDVREVQIERDRISTINEVRRNAWQDAMNRHNALCKQVEHHREQIAVATQKATAEMKRREENKRLHHAELRGVEDFWAKKHRDLQIEFTIALQKLEQAKREFDGMKQLFESERLQLTRTNALRQRDEYLKTVLIADAEIDGIKKGRKATLAAYGIETAYDVPQLIRLKVPGFGTTYSTALFSWRAIVENQFRYNPQQILTPSDLRSLHMKYQSRRTASERTLRGGFETLDGMRQRVEREWNDTRRVANKIADSICQAEADLRSG